MKNLTPAKMILLVVLAFGGMIGLFVVKRLMAVEPPPKKALTRTVPLALADLKPGQLITDKHIGMGPWPADDVKGDMLLSSAAPVGRIVKEAIKAATPFHGKALYSHGEKPPLSVSSGYQAVTLKVTDNTQILSGLIKAGDHVDIKFTLKEAQMRDDPRIQKLGGLTMTLLKGVQVLAINTDFLNATLQPSANSITLEVHEADANLLLLAMAKGDLTFTFTEKRNESGRSAIALKDSDRATLEELLGLDPLPEPPSPKQVEPPQVTDVYRGSGRNTLYFRDNYPAPGPYPSGYGLHGYPMQYNGPGSNQWQGGRYNNGNNSNPYWGTGGGLNDFNPNAPYGYGPAGANSAPRGVPSTMSAPGNYAPNNGNYGPGYDPGYGPGYGAPGYGPPGNWNPGVTNPSYGPMRDQVSSTGAGRRR